LIVFDLSCDAGDHRFEAWFGSSESFADQQKRGLISCPICGDTRVKKAVMAPRIGAKSNQRADVVPASSPATPAPNAPGMAADAQAVGPEMVRRVMAELAAKQAEMLPQSRWVGNDFADAARAMHEGRTKDEMIHGQTSPKEARDLLDEGIAAMPLLCPVVPPESVN
jgi:hypothetical protein